MRALRFVLALLVVAAAILLIVRGILPRIECNRDKGRMNRDVRRAARTGDENERTSRAAANVIACRRCLEIYPEDFQLHMLLAASLRILGDPDAALASYERALAITERPEIYAQMGEIEIERGNVEAARKLLTKAAMFNTSFLEVVDEPMRSEIAGEVLMRHEHLRTAR
jgi:tetratricopeptide (TPR) repeat protein